MTRRRPRGPGARDRGLAALTYAIIEAGRIGFGAAQIVALLVLALGCFAALVRYELRRREPLLEVRFFTSAPFAGAEGERGRLDWGHGSRSPSCRFIFSEIEDSL